MLLTKLKNVTPVVLSKALSVSPQMAGMMLKGKRGISTWHLDAVANLLQVDVPELFMDEEYQRTWSSRVVSQPPQSAERYGEEDLAPARSAIERIIDELVAVAERLPRGQAAMDRRSGSGSAPRPRRRRKPSHRKDQKKAPPL